MNEKTKSREDFQKRFEGLLDELHSNAEKVQALIEIFQNEDLGHPHGMQSPDHDVMFEVLTDYNNKFFKIIKNMDVLRDYYILAKNKEQEAQESVTAHAVEAEQAGASGEQKSAADDAEKVLDFLAEHMGAKE